MAELSEKTGLAIWERLQKHFKEKEDPKEEAAPLKDMTEEEALKYLRNKPNEDKKD
ncbi:MAG: hypothetical protein ABIE46_03755 [Patescibacteria group bacterium]